MNEGYCLYHKQEKCMDKTCEGFRYDCWLFEPTLEIKTVYFSFVENKITRENFMSFNSNNKQFFKKLTIDQVNEIKMNISKIVNIALKKRDEK